MEVYKVGEVDNRILRFLNTFPFQGEIVAILTALDVPKARPDSAWTLELSLDDVRALILKLPPWIIGSPSPKDPIFLPNRQLVFCRSQLFIAESPPKTPAQCDEIVKEVHKRILGETSEPARPMPIPPGIPQDYVPLWVSPQLAIKLLERYAGTDAIYASVPASDVMRRSLLAERPGNPVSVEGLLYELDKLIGLGAVKQEVRSLINHLRVQQLRKREGLPVAQMTMHLVFTGNPGTGKTTVARLLAKIYKAMGFLPEGQFVETDRSGLVGEYVGHTAPKTLKVIQEAFGGILFVDEAYALTRNTRGQQDAFGLEAVDTLIKAMEDNRENLVVIAAGYPDEMKQFIGSNPGLRSRFTRYLSFPDYTPEEMLQIFESQISDGGYMLNEQARNRAREIFQLVYENRGEGFGNGRWVRTVFERASLNLSNRIASGTRITRSELMTLQVDDLESIDTECR